MRKGGSQRGEASRIPELGLCEVVHDDFSADAFKDLLDKLHVPGMGLVCVLGLFARKQKIQGDLVGLVHDFPVTGHHSPHVELEYSGDVFQVTIGAGDEFVGSARCSWIRPKNHDM